ncbi:MAG: hypothetical protein EOP04_00150 [Proteobacteria bacterium]|nr:MAG: hypothetical protein EOP04_00150 [Pseudomonadota bacterium]
MIKNLLLVSLVFAGCKTVIPVSKSMSVQKVPVQSSLDTLVKFNDLSLPNAISYPFVKFSYIYGVPQSEDIFDTVFYQNTKKYQFHFDFFKENIARYKDIDTARYECLILPPRGDEGCSSVKEITAGALYYRPASEGQPEILGYEIYFRSDSSGTALKTKIDVAEVARLDKKLKASISFLPSSSIQYILPQKADFFAFKSKLEAAGVKIVKGWEFHKPVGGSKSYVPASSYGYLRKISSADFDAGLYSDRDILMFDNVPLDVGPLSGIITLKPAAAHSHVIFRAQNMNVPAAYIPEAEASEKLNAYIGKIVKFTTRDDNSFVVEGVQTLPDIEMDAQTYWSGRRQKLPTPLADLSVKTVKVWNNSGVVAGDIKSFGAKATNFAILDKALVAQGIDRTRYSNGFMVPFSFFDLHMDSKVNPALCVAVAKKCKKDLGRDCSVPAQVCAAPSTRVVRDFLDKMIKTDNLKLMNDNPNHRREFLSFAQRLIREVPVSSEIVTPIREAMKLYPPHVRMRLRSSTNAEDIAGLNGAGLYESKSACLGDSDDAKDNDGQPSACRTSLEVQRMKAQANAMRALPDPDGKLKASADEIESDINKKYPLSKTIGNVYASLWTERAFLTREYYGLEHLEIFMGLLGHPSFVDESANGVAVVEFKDGKPISVIIEAQYDDISVTNPIFPDTIPEHWSVVLQEGQPSKATLLSPSTLSKDDKRVLADAEAVELSRQLAIAAKALREVRGGDRYDLEFILGNDREVLVKQGRPL